MHESTSSLGHVIKSRREALGLTQEDLAERIGDGVRQSDVSRLERDRIQLPRLDRLRSIARALDLELADLMVAAGWGTTKSTTDQPDGQPDVDATPMTTSEPCTDEIVKPGDNEDLLMSLRRLRAAMAEAETTRQVSARIVARSEGATAIFDAIGEPPVAIDDSRQDPAL